MTLILKGTDNSVSDPAVQGGTGGATTGVYYPASNQVALATNGTQALLIDSSQNTRIGTGSPTAGYKLDINGNLRVAGSGPTELGFGQFVTARLNATANGSIFGFVLDGSQSGTYNGRDWRIEQGRNTVGNFNITEITGSNPVRLSINGSGNVGLSGANAVANGIGICFPASQSASSDANTLDDYEEGTFNVTLWDGTTQSTSTTAYYVKIGGYCWCTIDMYSTTISSLNTSHLRIANLPFNPSVTCNSVIVGTITSNDPILCQPIQNQNYAYLYASTSGSINITALTKSQFSSSSLCSLWGQFGYRCD